MTSPDPKTTAEPNPQRILAVDVGGSGLKAAVLDHDGNLLTERARIKTPHPCPPEALVNGIAEVVQQVRRDDYQAVSVGVPGMVRRGRFLTAPSNLQAPELVGFDLAAAVAQRLGRPTRVLNDADMQGLGTITGQGLEMVATLGTGFGSALFTDGRLGPHLELSMHPLAKGETYDERLGNATRERIGHQKWLRRVRKAIETLRALTSFDLLHLGGGNAKFLDFELPRDVRLASNENGLRGGAWLWRQTVGMEAETAGADLRHPAAGGPPPRVGG